MASSPPRPTSIFDARPLLQAGKEPFQAIMQAVTALTPGEALVLYAPFRPVPLFTVMAERGFACSDRELDDGSWEVTFTPVTAEEMAEAGLSDGSSGAAGAWPEPIAELDLRDLDPPEPMVRIMETLEELLPGDTLFALLAREPVFLFPELARRGHEWAGNFDASKTTYRLMVRAGEEKPA